MFVGVLKISVVLTRNQNKVTLTLTCVRFILRRADGLFRSLTKFICSLLTVSITVFCIFSILYSVLYLNNLSVAVLFSSQGTYFVITDLYFACKYRVSVKPLTEQGQRSEVMTSVTTPTCSSLMSRRKKASACVRDGTIIFISILILQSTHAGYFKERFLHY